MRRPAKASLPSRPPISNRCARPWAEESPPAEERNRAPAVGTCGYLHRAPFVGAVRLRCRSIGPVRHGLIGTPRQGAKAAFNVLQARRNQNAVLVVEITTVSGSLRAFAQA